MKPEPDGSVAREPGGGALPGRYLPVSTPWAIGENTICPMPSFSHSGITSDSMTRQIMLYCGWLDTMRSKPISSAIRSAAAISSARHSDTPTYSTLPCRTRSSKARRVSASGVSWSYRCAW
jgi:hypothetical protein